MRRTCADGHGLHELLSPGVSADQQRQVSLLDQFINSALKHSKHSSAPSSDMLLSFDFSCEVVLMT